jgi:L-ascorbate metabolism protein UlaG (beta-lactamase superfamily)
MQLGELASLLGSVVDRGRRERADRTMLEELAWSVSDTTAQLPAGLTLRWLGVAGYALSYQGRTLLIDPYLTRLSLPDFLRRRPVRPNEAVINRHVLHADAILIGHTHFDHSLDAPAIAGRDGCNVYGSGSVATLLDLYGLGNQAVVVEPYRAYEIGPFVVTFVPSRHAKIGLGLRVPYSGPITCEQLDHLTPQAYRCDQVWGIHIAVSGVTFYHQGSADLVDDAIQHQGVDFFLCGIAGRQFSPQYVERVLSRLQPAVVVPNHYDNFFRPLDDPLSLTLGADITGFCEEVRGVSADIAVRSLEPSRHS